jgi:hypothetical protein
VNFLLKFCLGLINTVETCTEYFKNNFGIFGKYIVSPAIELIALVIYIIIVILGAVIGLQLFLFKRWIQILKSKKILIIVAWLILVIVVISPIISIFGYLDKLIALAIWLVASIMYLILEYVADRKKVILPLQ